MLFFDLDGTLLDSNGIWLDIDIEFLGRHGIAPVPEDYTEYVTHHSPLDAARYTRTRFGLSETAEEIRQTWLQMARAAYAGKLELKRSPCPAGALPAAGVGHGGAHLLYAGAVPGGSGAAWDRGLVPGGGHHPGDGIGEAGPGAVPSGRRRSGGSRPRTASCLRIRPATALRRGRRASMWQGCGIPCTPAGRRSCAACAAAGWTAWSSSLRSWRRACFPGHKKAGDGSSNELPSPACSVENG